MNELITREVSEFLEECNCPICASEAQQVIYPATRRNFDLESLRREFSSSGGIPLCEQLVQCRGCGLRYVSPRLKEDIVLQCYSEGDDERFVSQNAARIRSFSKNLDKVEKAGVLRAMMRVFDIGSAGAAFLKACQERGFVVDGCEPNRWLCSWVRENYDIKLRPGILADQLPMSPQEKFDLVTMWDVLEHVANPRELLEQVATIIEQDGVLVLTFPDMSRLIARVLGRRWSYLSTVHLWYFTPKTIQQLLDECGFDTIVTTRHFHRLELGYLFSRAKETLPSFGVVESLVEAVGLGTREVPYWIGQSMVVAKYRGPEG